MLLHKQIEAMLGSPITVAVALIVGGVAILGIERFVKEGDVKGVADIPLPKVIGIGLIQCLAMVPGVSRSGATILGALSLGVERRTAAEFSFFLAIPTMLGATVLRTGQQAARTGGGEQRRVRPDRDRRLPSRSSWRWWWSRWFVGLVGRTRVQPVRLVSNR